MKKLLLLCTALALCLSLAACGSTRDDSDLPTDGTGTTGTAGTTDTTNGTTGTTDSTNGANGTTGTGFRNSHGSSYGSGYGGSADNGNGLGDAVADGFDAVGNTLRGSSYDLMVRSGYVQDSDGILTDGENYVIPGRA